MEISLSIFENKYGTDMHEIFYIRYVQFDVWRYNESSIVHVGSVNFTGVEC